MRVLVTDKDGTLYSFQKYIDPFARYLSKNFNKEEFMQEYHCFKQDAKIGKKYNPKTLKEDPKGKEVDSAIWFPALIAIKHGLPFEHLQKKFELFYPNIVNDEAFPYEPVLQNIFRNPNYNKVLVTNNDMEELLEKINLTDAFDIKFQNANKSKNLDTMCLEIEKKFSANPDQILWLEDSTSVLKRLKRKGYVTALRKTKGFNYISDNELSTFSDLILEDELSTLYGYMTQKC